MDDERPRPPVELALDVRAELGEGPVWDARRREILFVDIMRGHVHAYRPDTARHRRYEVGRPVGAIVCSRRGDWVLAAGTGFARLDPDTGRVSHLAEAAADRTDVRMNDGYVDPRGRFWAGTMSLVHAAGQGTLYRLDADATVHAMLAPVTTSNGIDWSPDGTRMYYADTRTRRVDVFDFDVPTGAIAGRRPFATFADGPGRPDGLVVDAEGGVWVALWRGGALRRYHPDGRFDRAVPMPATLVTKCAFGGPDLGDLYVTTATSDLSAVERQAEPHAGGLFRLRPGERGQPGRLFAG